ncbi:hypothetical protein DASB73_026790 [Starmerella bacillaris]|uniref:Uncharacterized protein n=1 Tax=Starmerella bacillaris TaxID=1247836 RepID=A0AAV5RM49_STABA|nr:hypothetical protein DASB73_026790 [Starmerella bacillaris]
MDKKDEKSNGSFSSGLLQMKFMQKFNKTSNTEDKNDTPSKPAQPSEVATPTDPKKDPGAWSLAKKKLKPRNLAKNVGFSDIFKPLNTRKSYGALPKNTETELADKELNSLKNTSKESEKARKRKRERTEVNEDSGIKRSKAKRVRSNDHDNEINSKRRRKVSRD